MGTRTYDREVSDIAADSSNPDNVQSSRMHCSTGQAAIYNTNPYNLKVYTAADMTCTSAQRVSAKLPGGNQSYYEQRAAALKQPSASGLLALLVSRAADAKGRCEAAAEAGFTLGYEGDAALTSEINPQLKANLRKLASLLSDSDIRRITDECYTPEIENRHKIGGLELTETQAGLLAGIRHGQQAKIDHEKLRKTTEAPASGLPSLLGMPANAAEPPARANTGGVRR